MINATRGRGRLESSAFILLFLAVVIGFAYGLKRIDDALVDRVRKRID